MTRECGGNGTPPCSNQAPESGRTILYSSLWPCVLLPGFIEAPSTKPVKDSTTRSVISVKTLATLFHLSRGFVSF